MKTILDYPANYFSEEKANETIELNKNDESKNKPWTYKKEYVNNNLFKISVYDEDGRFINYL